MPAWRSPLAPQSAPNALILVACGLLWGCAIAGIETLREPPVGAPLDAIVHFMASLMSAWCLMGICWSLAAYWAARRPSRFRLFVTWAGGVAVLGGVQTVLNVAPGWLNNTAAVGAIVGGKIPFDAMLTHLLWLHAVFGGLYVAGYAAFERAVRSRRQLARVQLALSDEAALWEEARLATLRGALQPQVLVQAVRALQARYEADPGEGDALLERLVIYLRAATGARTGPQGGHQSGHQTSRQAAGDDVKIAEAKAALISALGFDPLQPHPPFLSPFRNSP